MKITAIETLQWESYPRLLTVRVHTDSGLIEAHLGAPFFGIALADFDLRKAFWQKYPATWDRIQKRRNFMRNALDIKLKPEALPFSNLPAYLPPFWLSPQLAMRATH